MKRRPSRIVGLVIYGIFVCAWNLILGIGDTRNLILLIISLVCIFLSFGLFMLWNWVRFFALIFSFLFIASYLMLIVAAINRAYQGFAGITAILDIPTLIYSLLLIDNLRRKEIKAYFK